MTRFHLTPPSTAVIAFSVAVGVATSSAAQVDDTGALTQEASPDQSPLPMPQDLDAEIDKAKPADEMLGQTAPNGTDLGVDPDSATVDGRPRTSENSFVNTESEEAEVGIPNSE